MLDTARCFSYLLQHSGTAPPLPNSPTIVLKPSRKRRWEANGKRMWRGLRRWSLPNLKIAPPTTHPYPPSGRGRGGWLGLEKCSTHWRCNKTKMRLLAPKKGVTSPINPHGHRQKHKTKGSVPFPYKGSVPFPYIFFPIPTKGSVPIPLFPLYSSHLFPTTLIHFPVELAVHFIPLEFEVKVGVRLANAPEIGGLVDIFD